MALNREDKADVKGAFGKAIANKVAKVTRDKKIIPRVQLSKEKLDNFSYSVTDAATGKTTHKKL